MAIFSCDCTNPAFGNLGRPNCVIEMRVMAFPILVPRFKANGDRNTIDVTSATLGQDIQDLIDASVTTSAQERIYPFPRVEEPTWERTETVYDTASSTRKFKVFGVGGVYTLAFQLWGKDAVNAIIRELKKFGCSDVDLYIATVDGNFWGIKDDKTDTIIRGVELNTETYDVFKTFATSTTVEKTMVQVDLENTECVEDFYAITSEEMINSGGVKSTSLRANLAGCQTLSAIDTTHTQSVVFSSFGTAGVRDSIEELLAANFTLFNITTQLAVPVLGVVETTPGTYSIEYADVNVTPGDDLRVTIIKNGLVVEDANYTGTL